MQKVLEKYTCEEMVAERDWLAFWGIKRESTKGLGFNLSG